jgi:hypothetical protein
MIRDAGPDDEIKSVLERVKQGKEFIKNWHTNIRHWRDLYDMKHYKGTKARSNETQFSDPTHTNTTDLAVGIMLANTIRWHSFGIVPSFQEQKETGQVEKVIEGIWSINDLREEKNSLYEVFRNFSRDGGGIIYSVFDPDIAASAEKVIDMPDADSPDGVKPVRVFTEIPVRAQIIDPLKFIGVPGGPHRWQMVGRVENMSVREVELLYDVEIPMYNSMPPEQKATAKGEFMDIWEYVMVTSMNAETEEILGKKLAVRNTVLFDNFAVKEPRIMEGYTELPYTVQFFKPTGDKSEEWSNIMVPMESSVSLLERAINRRSHQIDVYTGLPIVSKTQPGRVVQVDAGLFEHVQLAPDETIEFPAWPGNAPDVQLHIDFLRTRTNQSGFSETMFGSGGSGDAAGYAIAQAVDMNRIRLEQPITHMELLLNIWAVKVLNLLTTFGADRHVCVYGQHLGKDYRDYIEINSLKGYALRAEIRPNFPAERSRKVAMATQIKGILSNHTIMEQYLDIEQPEDEEQRKLIEAATFNPITMQYALIAEMTARANEGDKVAEMTLQSLMNGGLPGQPGRPDGGPKPVSAGNLGGTPSATGMPTPQEGGGEPAGQSAADRLDAVANTAPKLTGA